MKLSKRTASWRRATRSQRLWSRSKPPRIEINMPKTTLEQNKALVLEVFNTLFNKRDYEAAARFWSDTYIQRSAHIEPGRDDGTRPQKPNRRAACRCLATASLPELTHSSRSNAGVMLI